MKKFLFILMTAVISSVVIGCANDSDSSNNSTLNNIISGTGSYSDIAAQFLPTDYPVLDLPNDIQYTQTTTVDSRYLELVTKLQQTYINALLEALQTYYNTTLNANDTKWHAENNEHSVDITYDSTTEDLQFNFTFKSETTGETPAPTGSLKVKDYVFTRAGSISSSDIMHIKLLVLGVDNKLYSTDDSDTPLTLVNGIDKNVKKIYNVGYTAYILTEDNELYGWGLNEYGQLGQGHNNSINGPIKIEGINQDIKEIYSINDCATIYALTENGEIYSWGNNKHYLLGTDNNNIAKDAFFTPQKLNIPAKITSLIIREKSENYAVFALTETGEIYTWGINRDSNLGLGEDLNNKYIPYPMLNPNINNIENIFIVSGQYASSGYNYAVAKDGTLYYWGMNYDGNIIHSPEIFQWEYGKIAKMSYLGQVYTALTENGEFYVWGYDPSNNFIKLSNQISETPSKISYVNDKIKDILVDISLYPDGMGDSSTIILLTTSGEVYQWTEDDILELENSGGNNILTSETLKTIPEKVTKLLYDENNNIHAVTENNNIYSWGNNKYGTLGIGSAMFMSRPVYNPEKLNIENVTNINSIDEVMFALTSNQELYYWGQGLGYYDYTTKPTLIQVQ